MLVGHVLPPPLYFSCYFYIPCIVTWVESVNISKLDILSIYSFGKIVPRYLKKGQICPYTTSTITHCVGSIHTERKREIEL